MITSSYLAGNAAITKLMVNQFLDKISVERRTFTKLDHVLRRAIIYVTGSSLNVPDPNLWERLWNKLLDSKTKYTLRPDEEEIKAWNVLIVLCDTPQTMPRYVGFNIEAYWGRYRREVICLICVFNALYCKSEMTVDRKKIAVGRQVFLEWTNVVIHI